VLEKLPDSAREVTLPTDGFAPLQVFIILVELVTVNNNLLNTLIQSRANSTDGSRKLLYTQLKIFLEP
jgi:hypothetical protein